MEHWQRPPLRRHKSAIEDDDDRILRRITIGKVQLAALPRSLAENSCHGLEYCSQLTRSVVSITEEHSLLCSIKGRASIDRSYQPEPSGRD